jgi:hypothetical protein
MSRANAALILGMSEGKIYNIESGITQKRIIFCQNVQKQLNERRSPGDGEKRCDCCGKIRKVEEFRVSHGKPKKNCDLCGRGWIDGEQVSFKMLDALPTIGSVKPMITAYKRTNDYPHLLHLAMRQKGIPTMQIAKKLGVRYNKCKKIASKMGVADPKTKICGSGSNHPSWKGGKVQASITDDWIWNQEVKQYRRAKRLSCWSQHIEAQRWGWRKKAENETPDQRKKRLKARERYRRDKLGQLPREERNKLRWGSIDQEDRKATLRLRENLRQNTVDKYKNGSNIYSEWLGCTGAELREWLERQFTKRMTHDNYGTCWNIDHIVPLSSFDLTDRKQYEQAANFTNLQPMYCMANSKKGAETDGQLSMALQLTAF